MNTNKNNYQFTTKEKIKTDKSFSKLKIRNRNGVISYMLLWSENGKRKTKTIPLKYKDEGITSIRNRAIKMYETLIDIQEGIIPDPAENISVTYQQLFNDYIDDCKSRNVKTKHIEDCQRNYNNWVKSLAGNIVVSDLKRKNIKEVFKKATKHSKSVANKTLKMIIASLNFAVDEETYGIDFNVGSKIKAHPDIKIKRSYTDLEKAKIFNELNSIELNNPERYRTVGFIWLLILTGARKGEIAQARWEWIKDNKIIIPVEHHKTGQKTGEERVIYLNEPAMQVINKLSTINPKTKTITGIVTPYKLWRKITNKCNCPDIRLHDLRHSFATMCISANISTRQVGALLGHKSLASMQRYGEVTPQISSGNVNLAAEVIDAQIIN